MELEKLIVKIQADISDLQNKLKQSASAVGQTQKDVEKSTNKIKQAFAGIGKGLSTAFGKPLAKMSQGIKGALHKIKGMFEQAFTFGVLGKAVGEFGKKIQAVLSNNTQLSSKMAQLKGSFDTAIQPLINILIPALEKAVDVALNLTNAFARMSSTLSGKSVKAVTEQAKAQQKLLDTTKTTASFDQLNKVGSGSDADYSSVIADANSTVSLIDTIKQSIATVWDWIDNGLAKIGSLLPDAIGMAGEVGDSLLSGLSNSINAIINYDWSKITSSIVSFVSNLVGSVTNTINGINWTGVIDGLFDIIFGLVESIVNGDLLSNLYRLLGSLVSQVINMTVRIWQREINLLSGIVTAIKDYFKNKIDDAGGNIGLGLLKGIGDAFVNMGNWVYNKITKPFVDALKSNLSPNVISAFTQVKNGILSIMDKIANGIKSPINSILTFINKMISGLTSGFNSIIKGLNKLSFDIPDWAIFGDLRGKKFGFAIPEIRQTQIPMLAQGGIVNQPTMAMIGERGREAVLPLTDESWMISFADILARRLVTNDKLVINLDGKQLGWGAINNINKITRQTGSLQLVMR